MTYTERVEIYKKIEKIRERPLISYVTSIRPFASGQMASDVISEIAKQILEIPESETKIDILIISNGGDPTVSWRIISMLRERFSEIGLLISYTAYSAATLLALGANEIVMHPFSNLGPVDPQLSQVIPGKDGENDLQIEFGSEDLRNFLDFVREDVGISDQEQLERSFEFVCKEIGAIRIGVAKRSSHLALSMGEQLLKLHMKDHSKAKAIAEALNSSFYHHGYPLGRNEAKKIGLCVIKPENELENLLWDVWVNIEKEMECNNPFNPIEIVFEDEDASNAISTVPQVQIPPNLPPEVLNQAYMNILNNIEIISVEPVDYEMFLATLESIRCKSECRSLGKINAMRMPDMRIGTNIIPLSQGWEFELNEETVGGE